MITLGDMHEGSAPSDPKQLEAFDRMVDDWGQWYRTAYKQLAPDMDTNQSL